MSTEVDMAYRIKRLEHQADLATGEFSWARPEDLLDLLSEVLETKESQRTPQERWNRLNVIEHKVGEKLVKELAELTEFVLNDRYGRRIPSLIAKKELMKDSRLPRWLKSKLQPTLTKVYEALNANSVREAESIISQIEDLLKCAEENATNNDLSASARLRLMVEQERITADLLARFDQHKHLRFVGLPAAAQKRGASEQQLMDNFRNRGLALQKMIPELKRLVEYEAEHAEEIRAGQAITAQQEYARLIAKAKEDKRQQEIKALVARCPKAKEFVSRFEQNLLQNNLNAAFEALQQIRRLDGGVPLTMLEQFHQTAVTHPL